MSKINYESLVADLVQELLDYGADQNDLIWMLTQYGYTEKQIKEYYGLPYNESEGK